VDAGYLQRFNIAPKNESYVISVLRFLGLVDDDGNQISDVSDYFFGSDDSFRAGLEANLRNAYRSLFDEMGEDALTAEQTALTHWFRQADKSSEVVGKRQAKTFQTLVALAGHGEVPRPRGQATQQGRAPDSASGRRTAASTPAKEATTKRRQVKVTADSSEGTGVGLSVRIEVNLPSDGDPATYDAIFASIKKHLMS